LRSWWLEMWYNSVMDITCSICERDFSVDGEGGLEGEFGMIPMALCPTCLASCLDMSEQMRLPIVCPKCGWEEGEE